MFRASSRCSVRLKQLTPIRFYSADFNNRKPPSILFFGTDSFSVASLQKLYETGKKETTLYRSLKVVTPDPRPKDRGLRSRATPLQVYAENQKIPFHTISRTQLLNDLNVDFREIDLLIAVSFGLFIPARIIEQVESTINVHPSLLPQYRGPAPIHNAILNGDKHTGITLQTLSPNGFDKGIIFSQSLPIRIEDDETFLSLWNRLSSHAAEMLVSSVRDQTYLKPTQVETFTNESYAGFVHKQIDWWKTSADEVIRLGRLYDPITGAISLDEGKRIDVSVKGISLRQQGSGGKPPGTYFIARHVQSGDKKMAVVCNDRKTVWVEQVKVSGKSWISGLDFVSTSPDRFWGERFVPWRKEFEDHDQKEFQY